MGEVCVEGKGFENEKLGVYLSWLIKDTTVIKEVLLLFTLIPALLYGQDTKKTINHKNDEEYYVLKSDKNVKHGEYKKFGFGLHHILMVRGFYKNGIKDSIWEYYNMNGEVIQKFDWSRNVIIYSKPDIATDVKGYKVPTNDNKEVVLSRVPIFLGGDDYLFSVLWENITYPPLAYENNIFSPRRVSFGKR